GITGNASASAVVDPINDTVYVAGGRSGVIQRATQNDDGTLSSWTSQTVINGNGVGPENPIMTIANGFLYIIGGKTYSGASANVWAAKINTDGSLNTAISTTSLPTGLAYSAGGVINGYVYVIGGENSTPATTQTVYYAGIGPNGTLGAWN